MLGGVKQLESYECGPVNLRYLPGFLFSIGTSANPMRTWQRESLYVIFHFVILLGGFGIHTHDTQKGIQVIFTTPGGCLSHYLHRSIPMVKP